MIRCDLTRETLRLTRQYDTVVHAAGTADRSLAMELNHGGTTRLCSALEKTPPRHMVYISSVAVYGAREGTLLDEDTPLRPTTAYGKSKAEAEKYLAGWCAGHDVTLSILRPALIIGTGMNGNAAAMARGIDNGYYFHIKGNEARRSVIHAADVALAARLIAPAGGIYNLADDRHPRVHDLAEAIAHRLGDKRIFTLPGRVFSIAARIGDTIGAIPFSTDRLRHLTETLTFSNEAIKSVIPFEPRDVTDYLLHHDYGQETL